MFTAITPRQASVPHRQVHMARSHRSLRPASGISDPGPELQVRDGERLDGLAAAPPRRSTQAAAAHAAARQERHRAMTDYTLPDLPYDYASLEPHISGRIMELHHDKHHAGYVKGANTALERLHDLREKGDFSTIAMLEKNLAFNVSGHVLHSVFW